MNARTKIKLEPTAADIKCGHAFRGEYLNEFARFEYWVSGILHDKRVTELSEVKNKFPPMLGQKIKLIKVLTKKHPSLFRSSQRISELLDQMNDYLDLRSDLAHASMETVYIDKAIFFIFTNSGQNLVPDIHKRTVLSLAEFKPILHRIHQIIKQITDQNLTK